MKNNKVNIKGRNYEIIKVDGELTNNGEKCAGVSDALHKKIYIKNRENTEDMLQTIIHELIHSNFYECGLFDAWSDEDMPRYFEVQLLPILKQFLKVVKIVLPNKKYEANKIDDLLNNLFEVNNNDIYAWGWKVSSFYLFKIF